MFCRHLHQKFPKKLRSYCLTNGTVINGDGRKTDRHRQSPLRVQLHCSAAFNVQLFLRLLKRTFGDLWSGLDENLFFDKLNSFFLFLRFYGF